MRRKWHIKKFLASSLLAAVVLYACKHHPVLMDTTVTTDTTHHLPVDTTHHTPPGTPCNKDTVYFQNTILPLIISSCATAGCHDANTQADGKNFTTYAGIMQEVRAGKPNNSDLYKEVARHEMPPTAPLPQDQINLIYKWIAQGARNNKCTETTCDTGTVTFSGTITGIVQGNCLGCHNPSTASGGVRLDSYAGVSSVAKNGQLVNVITGAAGYPAMPQGGRLSDCQILQIKKWVRLGAPQN